MAPADSINRGRLWAGYLLGFALGGFFDGILLHQILQWHHLLLGIRTEPFQDMRVQLLADGLFHLLMYCIALAGLWSLWRTRNSIRRSGTELLGDALIGFGVWHILDAVVSHWILGIHRIKMDSPNPLLWDLLWFVVFGIGPLLAGLFLHRRGDNDGGAAPNRPSAVTAMLVSAALIGGLIAAIPPSNTERIAVLVRPSDTNRLLDGLQTVDGGILWADRSGALWVFHVGKDAVPERLYEYGALFITRSPAALGCLAWTRRGDI